MKMNRPITHLLLVVTVLSLASLFPPAGAVFGFPTFQGPTMNGLGANKEGGGGRPAPSPTSINGIPLNPQKKQQLQSLVDEALDKAKAAADKSDKLEVKDKLKNLSDEVSDFKESLQGAKTTDLTQLKETVSSINRRALEIERLAANPGLEVKPSQDAIPQSAPHANASKRGLIDILFENLLPLLALLLALVTLGGLLYMFSGLRIRLGQLEDAQKRSGQSVEKLRQVLGETKKYAESVGANLARVQDDLGLRIESAKRSSEEAKKLARAAEFAPAASVEPLRSEVRAEPIDPEPSFPATVGEYLNHIGGNRKKGVEADFRTNLLVLATDGSAPFVFVEDTDGSGAGIILPRPRLQRSQEFASLYKGYYYCTEPSAGEVYIIEPAIVERDGNGWRLNHPGRMEIR
jgi:hypothetical protein